MTGAPHATVATPLRYLAAFVVIAFLSGCSGTSRNDNAIGNGDNSGATTTTSRPASQGPARPVPDAQVTTPPKLPTKPDGPTVQVPSSVDASCNHDVTSDLQDVLSKAPDNSTVVFQQAGCYRIDGTLTIENRRRLDIDGSGATLRAGSVGDRSRKQLEITSSEDITVRDLIVVGSNERAGATTDAYDPDLAFQHAFALTGVHRVLLERVAASKLHGDFVYIGRVRGSSTNDVTVARSSFDGSGRQGIAVTQGSRVLIVDNDITNVARSMFDLEPNNPNDEIRDVRISGNRTGAAKNFWLANKGAGENIGPVEIDGNTMNEATGGLLFAFGKADPGRGPWNVRDNQLIANDAVHDEESVGAFLFAHCHDVSITGNHVTFPAGAVMPAIELRGSKGVRVAGNEFTGASELIVADAATSDVSTSS